MPKVTISLNKKCKVCDHDIEVELDTDYTTTSAVVNSPPNTSETTDAVKKVLTTYGDNDKDRASAEDKNLCIPSHKISSPTDAKNDALKAIKAVAAYTLNHLQQSPPADNNLQSVFSVLVQDLTRGITDYRTKVPFLLTLANHGGLSDHVERDAQGKLKDISGTTESILDYNQAILVFPCGCVAHRCCLKVSDRPADTTTAWSGKQQFAALLAWLPASVVIPTWEAAKWSLGTFATGLDYCRRTKHESVSLPRARANPAYEMHNLEMAQPSTDIQWTETVSAEFLAIPEAERNPLYGLPESTTTKSKLLSNGDRIYRCECSNNNADVTALNIVFELFPKISIPKIQRQYLFHYKRTLGAGFILLAGGIAAVVAPQASNGGDSSTKLTGLPSPGNSTSAPTGLPTYSPSPGNSTSAPTGLPTYSPSPGIATGSSPSVLSTAFSTHSSNSVLSSSITTTTGTGTTTTGTGTTTTGTRTTSSQGSTTTTTATTVTSATDTTTTTKSTSTITTTSRTHTLVTTTLTTTTTTTTATPSASPTSPPTFISTTVRPQETEPTRDPGPGRRGIPNEPATWITPIQGEEWIKGGIAAGMTDLREYVTCQGMTFNDDVYQRLLKHITKRLGRRRFYTKTLISTAVKSSVNKLIEYYGAQLWRCTISMPHGMRSRPDNTTLLQNTMNNVFIRNLCQWLRLSS